MIKKMFTPPLKYDLLKCTAGAVVSEKILRVTGSAARHHWTAKNIRKNDDSPHIQYCTENNIPQLTENNTIFAHFHENRGTRKYAILVSLDETFI